MSDLLSLLLHLLFPPLAPAGMGPCFGSPQLGEELLNVLHKGGAPKAPKPQKLPKIPAPAPIPPTPPPPTSVQSMVDQSRENLFDRFRKRFGLSNTLLAGESDGDGGNNQKKTLLG